MNLPVTAILEHQGQKFIFLKSYKEIGIMRNLTANAGNKLDRKLN